MNGSRYAYATEQTERRTTPPQLSMALFGRRISWASIFAGMVAATFVQMIMSALGTGIGANVVDVENNVNRGVGIGAGVWFGISTLVALFVGGWVAGRMSGIPRKVECMIHGFLTAGLSTLFVLFLVTSAVGTAFSGASSILGSGIQATANASQGTGLSNDISSTIENARARINQTNPQEVSANAQQATQAAAGGVATAGYIGFLVLLLGACAAMWGGYLSTPREMRKYA